MPTVEIVTHCYRYSRLLRYQLESFWRNYWSIDSPVQPLLTVFYHRDDLDSVAAIDHYRNLGCGPFLRDAWQPLEALFVRSIGRNQAALTTTADWIWFADCDYLFGPQCLRGLVAIDPEAVAESPCPLRFPRFVQTCRDWTTGDAYIDHLAETGDVREINPADFYPRGVGKAIGGIQIIPGRVAREKGYCNSDRKRQRPLARITPESTFDFSSDRAFRCQMGGYGSPVDLSDVFRLRHSRSFRDQGGADN